MPFEVTCDTCRHVLRIPDHVTELVLTCPRCLAKVVNPDVVLGAAPANSSAPAPRLEHTRDASAIPRMATPDADIRFDTRGTGVGLVVLAVLTAAGLGLFYLGGGFALVWGVPGGLAIAGVGVLFIVIALAAVALLRTPGLPTSAGVARGFMGGCMVGITVAVVLVALILAAVVSAVLTFVQTCAETCGPPPQKAPAKR